MLDVITFGSGSRDIFLKSKKLKAVKRKMLVTKEGISLSLGSKIDIEDIYYFSGGGGTNSAVAFAGLGLKTAYCGVLGEDEAGKEIVRELNSSGVDTSLINLTSTKKTNQSIVLNVKDKDRTILVYRGASEALDRKIFPLPLAKWLYIAPLSGKASSMFEKIVDYGKKKKMKIAVNPGSSQLALSRIKEIIKKIDILILNQEEAAVLSGLSYQKEEEGLKKICRLCKGIVVITKGPLGVIASDGRHFYKAGILKAKVVDRTGAGDAFSSGFISEYVSSNDIAKSIQLGTANAAKTIGLWGAKSSFLKKNEKFKRIKVEKNEIS